jgi:hypothetical protein
MKQYTMLYQNWTSFAPTDFGYFGQRIIYENFMIEYS